MPIPDEITDIRTAIQNIPQWDVETEMLSTPHLWNDQKEEVQVVLNKIADCLNDLNAKLDQEITDRKRILPVGTILCRRTNPGENGTNEYAGYWTQISGYLKGYTPTSKQAVIAPIDGGSEYIDRNMLPRVRLDVANHAHRMPTCNTVTTEPIAGRTNHLNAFDMAVPTTKKTNVAPAMRWAAKTVNYESHVFSATAYDELYSGGQFKIVANDDGYKDTYNKKGGTGGNTAVWRTKKSDNTSAEPLVQTSPMNNEAVKYPLNLPRTEMALWVRTS
jgi:hypothetical protein